MHVDLSKKCTQLWREARVKVKTHKTHHSRALLEVEMLCETHHMFGPHLEVAMSKSARRCGVKHISKLNVKNTPRSDHFCAFKRHCVWQAQWNQWILHLAKRVKCAGFVTFSKTMACRRETLEKMHVAWLAQYRRHLHQRCSKIKRAGDTWIDAWTEGQFDRYKKNKKKMDRSMDGCMMLNG